MEQTIYFLGTIFLPNGEKTFCTIWWTLKFAPKSLVLPPISMKCIGEFLNYPLILHLCNFKKWLRWNSHNINHLKVNNSLAFSTFTMLCKHHLFLVPKHFHLSKVKSLSIKPFLPIPPSFWHPLICILWLWIYLFWIFILSGMIQYVIFYVWIL